MLSDGFWDQIIITFIGVTAGVLLGGFATLLIQKKMNGDTKKEISENMRKSISDELNDAQKGIEAYRKDTPKWDVTKHAVTGEKPWILKPAYESAINSGNFIILDRKLQMDIGSVYLSIDAINFYADQLRRTPVGINTDTNMAFDISQKLSANVNKLEEKLKKIIPKLNLAQKRSFLHSPIHST